MHPTGAQTAVQVLGKRKAAADAESVPPARKRKSIRTYYRAQFVDRATQTDLRADSYCHTTSQTEARTVSHSGVQTTPPARRTPVFSLETSARGSGDHAALKAASSNAESGRSATTAPRIIPAPTPTHRSPQGIPTHIPAGHLSTSLEASNNGSTKSAQDVEIHSASHSKANTSSSTQTSAPSHFMAGCASQPVGVTQFATLQRPAPTLVPAPARRFAPPSPLHDSRLPVRAVESATSETVTQPHALPPQPSTSAPAAHILRAAILAHAQPFGNRYSRPAEPVLAASPSVRSEPPEGRDASPALAPTASSSDGPAREPQGAQVAPAPSASINAISPPSLSAPDGHAVALLSKVAPVQLDAVREGPDVLPPPAPSSASFDRAPPRVSIPTASAEPPTMHIASTPPPAPARALDDDNDTRGQTSFPHTTVQMPQRASDGEHVTAIAPEMADLLDALTPPPPPAKFRLVQVGAQVLRVPAGRGVPIGALLRERRDVAVVPPSRDRTQASVQPQEPQTQNTKKKKRRQKKRASRAGSGTPPLPY